MEGIIIYRGKYSATRQYAEWLAGELNLPLTIPGEVTDAQIESAGFFIIGTWVYYGKFRIRNWLKKNAKAISRKNCFLLL